MAAEIRRISIGMEGHQTLDLRVSDDAYQSLRKALQDDHANRWHSLPTLESEVIVDLSKVVYVSLASDEHRVGF
jgi:hypothetical protein